MNGLQNFVHRSGSPANGQQRTTDLARRKLLGANAKVAASNTTAKMTSNSRSPNPNQQNLIPIHQADRYDTDAESLDTTVGHSVLQVADSQPIVQESYPNNPIALSDNHAESQGEDEDGSDGESDGSGVDITDAGHEFLLQKGMLHLDYSARVSYLDEYGEPHHLDRTVDGDSYPTTTDGVLTEWDGQDAMQTLTHQPGQINLHPLIRQPESFVQGPSGRRHLPAVPNVMGPPRNMPQTTKIVQQAASLRSQERSHKQIPSNGGHMITKHVGIATNAQDHNLTGLPSYSQSVMDAPAQREQFNANPLSVRRAVVNPAGQAQTSSRRRPATRSVQQQVNVQPLAEPIAVCDYEHEKLFNMKYDELKNESFDKDPKADQAVLPTEELEKPLSDRLLFVREHFDTADQTKFFGSLPATEWEDAGDWFLEQFQAIIARTKMARNNKRKLAKDFEEEIDSRYEHVAKKQGQVEDALKTMKSRGENLVPRSPSKSPAPGPAA